MSKCGEMTNEDVVWKSFMFDIRQGTLKFLLNASIDTLPTGANLVRWNKKTSDKCNLCKMIFTQFFLDDNMLCILIHMHNQKVLQRDEYILSLESKNHNQLIVVKYKIRVGLLDINISPHSSYANNESNSSKY